MDSSYQFFCQDQKFIVDRLYKEYAKKLFVYTKNVYGINEDDSWTLVYKTLYKVAECGKDYQFDHEKKLAAFIFKTHINYLRNFFRDQKSFESLHKEVELEYVQMGTATEIINDTVSPLMKILQMKLALLEDWQRILLLMRSQGAAYSAISEFVSKPEKHLKVYYARLKKQISEKMLRHVHKLKGGKHEE